MVYFTIEKYKFGEWKFVWEYDSGMAPGGENIVYVSGPVEFTRYFYFEDANKQHIKNFCRKFARDAQYRRRCFDGTIVWVILSDLYELNVECLEREYELKHGHIFHGYLAGDRRAEQKHERVQEEFLDDCRDLYYFLKKNLDTIIRDPVYLHCKELKRKRSSREIDKRLEPIIQELNSISGVRTRFSCQGVGESITVGGKTIFIPDGHMLFAHVIFANLPDRVYKHLSSYLGKLAVWRVNMFEAKRAEFNREFIEQLGRGVREYLNSLEGVKIAGSA